MIVSTSLFRRRSVRRVLLLLILIIISATTKKKEEEEFNTTDIKVTTSIYILSSTQYWTNIYIYLSIYGYSTTDLCRNRRCDNGVCGCICICSLYFFSVESIVYMVCGVVWCGVLWYIDEHTNNRHTQTPTEAEYLFWSGTEMLLCTADKKDIPPHTYHRRNLGTTTTILSGTVRSIEKISCWQSQNGKNLPSLRCFFCCFRTEFVNHGERERKTERERERERKRVPYRTHDKDRHEHVKFQYRTAEITIHRHPQKLISLKRRYGMLGKRRERERERKEGKREREREMKERDLSPYGTSPPCYDGNSIDSLWHWDYSTG